jgi:cobalt-precorrin 5A hydrolase / precorrin-3B C17-methyltransferase
MERLWVGMGCQADTPAAAIGAVIQYVLNRHNLKLESVVGLATLDTKEAIGSLLCQQHDWQLRLFRAGELAIVRVPQPVARVADLVGTPTVAEAAAYLAAGQLLVPKEIHCRSGKYITVAIGIIPIYRTE